MTSFGKILDIDLQNQSWREDRTPPAIRYPRLMAGRGCNVAYLFDHLPPKTPALDPANILIFSCGLLTGKSAPASSRIHVNALSPLTGILGSSNMGGDFGKAMRTHELQTLIFKDRSQTPIYLFISKKGIEFRDAEDLWGLDAWETQGRLKDVHQNQDLQICCIGPGGENLNRFACIMSDLDHAAGRTGMGAVMGSKNLKAIVIEPGKKEKETDSQKEVEAIRRYVRLIRNSPEYLTFSEYGGAGYVTWANDLGILTTRNYRGNKFEAIDQIDGRKLKKHVVRARGCSGCPVRCKSELRFGNQTQTYTRPEFEPMVNLGSKCGLKDLKALVHLDNLCSRLGIDSISAGSAIAFAMDLFEREILTDDDTAGLDLSWGNAEAMESLLISMAYRTGLGATLSLGVRVAAELIGRGSEQYASHVKGLELAAYHPCNMMGSALGYAVSGRGGDFSSIYASMEYNWSPDKAVQEFGTEDAVQPDAIYGKAPLIKRAMLVNMALDCLGICKVPALSLIGKFDLVDEAELASALLGRNIVPAELFLTAERIVNLERLYNRLCGAKAEDDRLPPMFFTKEYVSSGKPSAAVEWIEPMTKIFYQEMGWCSDGLPTIDKLNELDIDIPEGMTLTPASKN